MLWLLVHPNAKQRNLHLYLPPSDQEDQPTAGTSLGEQLCRTHQSFCRRQSIKQFSTWAIYSEAREYQETYLQSVLSDSPWGQPMSHSSTAPSEPPANSQWGCLQWNLRQLMTYSWRPITWLGRSVPKLAKHKCCVGWISSMRPRLPVRKADIHSGQNFCTHIIQICPSFSQLRWLLPSISVKKQFRTCSKMVSISCPYSSKDRGKEKCEKTVKTVWVEILWGLSKGHNSAISRSIATIYGCIY